MRSFSLHLGRHSAVAEHRPVRFLDAFRHREGLALWAGPLGLVVFTR